MNEVDGSEKTPNYSASGEFMKFKRLLFKDRELIVQKVAKVSNAIDRKKHFVSVLAQLGYALTTRQQADCYMHYRRLKFSFRTTGKEAEKTKMPSSIRSRLDLPTDSLIDRLVEMSGVPATQVLDEAILAVAKSAMYMRISITREIEHAYRMDASDVWQLGEMLAMFGKRSIG